MDSINKYQRKALRAALKAKPYLKALADRLLSLGGTCPCIWNEGFHAHEGFIKDLLLLGRVSNGKGAKLRLMQTSQCHGNAARLSARYPHLYQYETGFAVSSDGTWRPHSWCWAIKDNHIVETTELRVRYLGLTLNAPQEAA